MKLLKLCPAGTALLWDAEVRSLWWWGWHELRVGWMLAGLHLSAPVQKLKENLLCDGMLDTVAHSCKDNRRQSENNKYILDFQQSLAQSLENLAEQVKLSTCS